MAGGEGTRLRPLTSNQPKPMVPIVGKPCIEHIVELLRSPRHGRGRRHARLHAAGDQELLRRRRVARRQHRVLRRGAAARDGRLGPPREREARRHVPRHLRRRALRRRPRRARRPAQGDRRRGHDRAQVGRQPARVRDRRHRRRRQGRALPREAVLGTGLLGHDQHRHLRARARGADARPDRRAVRLLEGALPAPARDGPPDLRPRDGGLLAGHRQPRPVPAGELRRARRERATEHRGSAAARERLDRRGHRHPRRRGDRGPGVHRQSLPDHARRLDRAVHRPLERRHAARARADDALRDRRGDARRPERADRGRDHRPRLRHPRPRADPGGCCGRRRGHDRLRVEHRAARPDLPVQGGRDRLAGLREPDLGDARVLAPLRQGRRLRPRQRRPHARDGRTARDRARHGAEARIAASSRAATRRPAAA